MIEPKGQVKSIRLAYEAILSLSETIKELRAENKKLQRELNTKEQGE